MSKPTTTLTSDERAALAHYALRTPLGAPAPAEHVTRALTAGGLVCNLDITPAGLAALDMPVGRQLLANRPGVCTACGGSVAPNDLILWNGDSKSIVRCRSCPGGLQSTEGFKWQTFHKHENRRIDGIPARDRAAGIEGSRARFLRAVARGDEKRAARYEQELNEDVAAAAAKGLRAWERPTKRDLELARARIAMEAVREEQKDIERATDREETAA